MKKVWHPYWKWECFKSGFYASFSYVGITKEEGELLYQEFLSDIPLFESVLKKVITEWKCSCEHFLTESNRNHIAWLGQSSLAYYYGVPAEARGGFRLLTDEQQKAANVMAEKYWGRVGRGLPEKIIQELKKHNIKFKLNGLTRHGRKDLQRVVIKKFPDHLDMLSCNASDVASWKRFAITILKNDHTCKYMGLAPTKGQAARQREIMEKYKNI